MPFKSESQRKFFYAASKRKGSGITPETVKRWEEETPNKKLPEKAANLRYLLRVAYLKGKK